ncbi:MAG: hypothetical protein GC136_02815 [Alphaproteobacteria bacterium]|nr:hypothetical protein [Alphaproteobacteria bacterium]
MNKEQIINYLQHGGFEERLDNPEVLPWRLVAVSDGEKVAKWYDEEKPKSDLAKTQLEDPALYAALMEGQKQQERLRKASSLLFRSEHTRETAEELWRMHKETYPADHAAAEQYAAFIATSQNDFRPADYATSNHWIAATGASLLKYALLQNTETGEYMVTAHDARSYFKENKKDLDSVRHEIMPDQTGKNDEEILQAGHWLWAKHLTACFRYAPIEEPKSVAAMVEADRLRSIFGAAAEGDGTSAMPLRSVFEFLPAFRRAYEGAGGYYRALNDVYGAAGTLKRLMDIGVPHSHAPYGGKEEDALYGVYDGHWGDLYANMNERDRSDFRDAFTRFANTLPALDAANHEHGYHVSQLLSGVTMTLRHGRGVWQEPDVGNRTIDLYREFQGILAGNRKFQL